MIDTCSPDEDIAFAEISKYCYQTKQRIRLVKDELVFIKKPMKKPRSVETRRKERFAINKLLWR